MFSFFGDGPSYNLVDPLVGTEDVRSVDDSGWTDRFIPSSIVLDLLPRKASSCFRSGSAVKSAARAGRIRIASVPWSLAIQSVLACGSDCARGLSRLPGVLRPNRRLGGLVQRSTSAFLPECRLSNKRVVFARFQGVIGSKVHTT